MIRIKIQDLPRDRKISQEEMRKAMGGIKMIRTLPGIVPSPMLTPIGRSGILTLTGGSFLFTDT